MKGEIEREREEKGMKKEKNNGEGEKLQMEKKGNKLLDRDGDKGS